MPCCGGCVARTWSWSRASSASPPPGWRDDFLAAGEAALSARDEPDDRDLQIARLRAKVGELALANELLGTKIEHLEAGRPLARRRPRR